MNNEDIEESSIERVLRAAGGRDQPSESLERHVRAAVYAEWRATVARRRWRRSGAWFAAAASVAIAAFGLWVNRPPVESSRDNVARVSRVIGTVGSREHSWTLANVWRRWKPVDAQQPLTAGDDVMTGRNGRAALALVDGSSLRLDRDTRVALLDSEHVELLKGAVYVDAGTAPSGSHALRIDTPAGAVRHLGTQYEVRLLNTGVRIRVREGRVELRTPPAEAARVHAGEQLIVAPSGAHQRAAIGPSGMEWAWVMDAAPQFDMEGRSLRDFMAWVGRELGQEIVFSSQESEAEAERSMLHGSVSALAPAEALQAVLSTTRLHSRQQDGRILIELN